MASAAGRQTDILLETGTNELEVISFPLRWRTADKPDGQTAVFGINAAKVKELVAVPEEITPIPQSPSCVQGVFLLRNLTVPLIDLCAWFNFDPIVTPELRKKWVVVVSEINGKAFGFIAHGVNKVSRISWEQVQTPSEVISRYESLTSMCLIDNQIIQMVDFERIVAAIDPTMQMVPTMEGARPEHLEEWRQKTVVIADDSGFIRHQLVATLQQAGYQVKDCPDGQSAWDFLEELRKQGTVKESLLGVITDIEMPRMDGHRLCKLIKEKPEYASIPVLLFSSLISDTLRHKGEAVGADDQITKPELSVLIKRFEACVSRLQN